MSVKTDGDGESIGNPDEALAAGNAGEVMRDIGQRGEGPLGGHAEASGFVLTAFFRNPRGELRDALMTGVERDLRRSQRVVHQGRLG